MGLMREGRGLMFLSGVLFGLGIMLIIWAATPTTKLICTNPEIFPEPETIQVGTSEATGSDPKGQNL